MKTETVKRTGLFILNHTDLLLLPRVFFFGAFEFVWIVAVNNFSVDEGCNDLYFIIFYILEILFGLFIIYLIFLLCSFF